MATLARARTMQPQDFAVSPGGGVLAAVDGSEVLAWARDGVAPLWKAVGEARYRRVAVSMGGVWLVDEAGTLERRRPADGALLHRDSVLEGPGVALAAWDDQAVVADARAVSWVQRGAVVARLDLDGVVDVAFDEEERVALVDKMGTITVIAAEGHKVVGRVAVGGRPSAVVWHPSGVWLVVVGRHLRPVAADGKALHGALSLGTRDVRRLTVCLGGSVVAVQASDDAVEVLGWPDLGSLGHVRVGRDVVGLGGGHRSDLWLGLRHADVQGLDLASGRVVASTPHEGRARVPWGLDPRVDVSRIRGLHAARQTGGAPVAIFVPPSEDDGPPRWFTWLLYTLITVLVLMVVGGLLWVVWVALS